MITRRRLPRRRVIFSRQAIGLVAVQGASILAGAGSRSKNNIQ